jgi:hypothetical protein
MHFIDDEPPPTTPPSNNSSLVPSSVHTNPLDPTANGTFTAYKAQALLNPQFSCRWTDNSKITNIIPEIDAPVPLVPARFVVGRGPASPDISS